MLLFAKVYNSVFLRVLLCIFLTYNVWQKVKSTATRLKHPAILRYFFIHSQKWFSQNSWKDFLNISHTFLNPFWWHYANELFSHIKPSSCRMNTHICAGVFSSITAPTSAAKPNKLKDFLLSCIVCLIWKILIGWF